MPKFFSLRYQIAWRVGLLSIIAVVGMLFSVVVSLLVALASEQHLLHGTVHELVHELDYYLATIEADVTATAAHIAYLEAPEPLLRDLLQRHPSIMSVTLLDANGAVTSSRSRVAQTGANAPANPSLLPTDTFRWGEIQTTNEGIPLMTAAAPVAAASRLQPTTQAGTLTVMLDMTSLWDKIRTVQIGETGYAYLATQDGELLVHRNLDRVVNSETVTVPPSDVPDSANPLRQLRQLATLHPGIEYDRVLINSEHIEARPWLVAVEEPLSDILPSLYPLFAVCALLVLAIAGLLGNTGRFTYRRIIAPLRTLQHGVEGFREGDMQRRVVLPRHQQDEIYELAQTFNAMAARIEAHTDDLLLARAKALESSRLKSEFLSTISHELRTPMNAIIGYTDLLLEGLAGEFDDETRRMLTSVSKSSDRLLRLIDDLLDLSRIEAGKMEIVSVPFNPHELASVWMAEQQAVAQRKGLLFTCDVHETLPHTLYGDPQRITQIGMNLLTNAVKFTQSGEVRLELRRNNHEWIIRVTDTGVGIPQAAQVYIFDAFRQVDSSTTREHGGTGLGLSIVRNLATLMSGRVMLESTVGQGSKFTVTLPLITAPPPEASSPYAEREQHLAL